MMPSLEKVAEAVYESYREDIGRLCGDEPWLSLPEWKKQIARNQALAAMEAIQFEAHS